LPERYCDVFTRTSNLGERHLVGRHRHFAAIRMARLDDDRTSCLAARFLSGTGRRSSSVFRSEFVRIHSRMAV
jgi:hypothetical protein